VVLATASAPPSAAALIAAAGQALFSAAVTLLGINQLSLRQAVTPDRLQGRVNASRYVLVYGVQPIGALVAGALGSQFGTTQTLLATAAIEVVAFAVAVVSPLRSIRATPPTREPAHVAPA
jgi:hypothetical protein